MKKRILGLILCMVLCLSFMPMSVFAADIASGTGWNLSDDGVLHITGAVPESGFGLTYEQKLQVKSVVTTPGASISSGKSLFCEFENMTSADLSNLDTSSVTSMLCMFSNCRSLTSLDLSNLDTSSVTDMSAMFKDCNSLNSLNVIGFNTAGVTKMNDMFFWCNSLESLDLKSFDTKKVNNMADMFYNCGSLKSLDISSFSTSSVTDMYGMFSGCSSLTSLDVSGFKTDSVTDMQEMFYKCSSLTSLDVGGFETGKVKSMREMFSKCSGLTSLDVSGFNTSNVVQMFQMFQGCSSLTSLDISGFDISNLFDKNNNMYNMLGDCSSLTSLGICPDILSSNAERIIAIRSPWQKKGSTDIYSTADELKAVTENIVLIEPITYYTVTVQNDGNGTASADKTSYEKNETVTLTTTPATGYHFKEWQSTDVTVSGNTFTMPDKDVTVKAIFEADTYTVTFDMKGHGVAPTDQIVNKGEKATEPTDPSASGWIFDGWYADTACSVAFDFSTAINADTTIYAKWTEDTTPPAPIYAIIAGANGEWTKGSTAGLSFTSDAPFTKFAGVEIDGSTIAATNYTAEEGSTKITLAPAYLETLSVGSHTINVVSTDGTASTNFTVKAATQPPVPTTYTVTFNMGGHGIQPAAQTVKGGDKASMPTAPYESGYTFGGWYADAALSVKYDFNAAINADTTIYAKWTKNAGSADPSTPATGDNGLMFLWGTLLAISSGILIGIAMYAIKRRHSENNY